MYLGGSMTRSMFIWSSLAVFAFMTLLAYLAMMWVLSYISPRGLKDTWARTLWFTTPAAIGRSARYAFVWLCAYWLVLVLNWALLKHTATLAVRRADFYTAVGILIIGLGAFLFKKAKRKPTASSRLDSHGSVQSVCARG